jgi:hypothetical protein
MIDKTSDYNVKLYLKIIWKAMDFSYYSFRGLTI